MSRSASTSAKRGSASASSAARRVLAEQVGRAELALGAQPVQRQLMGLSLSLRRCQGLGRRFLLLPELGEAELVEAGEFGVHTAKSRQGREVEPNTL